jgi:hypothetical protein
METITDVPSLSSTWFHVYICGSDSIEIPNFKIVFENSHKHMQLQLDYLSREDLLSDPSLQYYDKFFVGLDEVIYNVTYNAEQSQLIKFQNRKEFINKAQFPCNNIYVVGEMISLNQGWTNSALLSCEKVFDRF